MDKILQSNVGFLISYVNLADTQTEGPDEKEPHDRKSIVVILSSLPSMENFHPMHLSIRNILNPVVFFSQRHRVSLSSINSFISILLSPFKTDC